MRAFFSAAMLVAVPLVVATSSAPTSAAMTSAACQPLTADNLQACCDDPRWSTLIQPGDHQFCARRNDQDTVRLGRKLKSRSGQTSADEDLPTGSLDKPGKNGSVGSGSSSAGGSAGGKGSADNDGNGGNPGVGNPGNGKDVGKGEKGMDHGDLPSGTRGNGN